ncbi:unnamed protein product [Rhizophagus irregularis]|nr:unnamed protein product [Rhizophagus irregularis]
MLKETKETDPKESNYYIDWLDKSIANEYFNYYEFSEFKNLELIGSGSHGSVIRANWENIENFFALKTFKNYDNTMLKELVNEIKLQKRVDFHENIIRFYGITKAEAEKYSLVLEYADDGTLKTYLNNHFNGLNWIDKYQLAYQLANAIKCLHVNGKREEIIDSTPKEYCDLFAECWKDDPDERPNIQNVVSILHEIIFPKQEGITITVNVNKEKEINQLEKFETISKSIGTMELNNELMSYNGLSISENNLSSTSIQTNISKISYGSTLDKINNIIIQKLIKVINRKHDKESINFQNFQQFINQQILQILEFYQSSDNLIKWLNNLIKWLTKQVNPQYIYLLGLLYYYNIGTKENSTKALELFLKASKGNYLTAQVYLGKCYNDGYGIECNKNLAFDWYRKSAENDSIIGQFYLGNCYEFGVGTTKDFIKSVHWYEKAAKSGNKSAKLNLANCYRLGKGVEKDELKRLHIIKFWPNKKFQMLNVNWEIVIIMGLEQK